MDLLGLVIEHISNYEITPDLYDVMGIYLLICLNTWLWLTGIRFVCHIIRAPGSHSIAKRRGIRHPWLAWLPVLDLWILGSISDQYRSVARGEVKNRRKWLVLLKSIGLVLSIVLVVQVVRYWMAAGDMHYSVREAEMLRLLREYLPVVLPLLLAYVSAVAAVAVMRFTALYHLFQSSVPRNAGLFLVLSILLPPLEGVLIFLCRKKDGGMVSSACPPAQL